MAAVPELEDDSGATELPATEPPASPSPSRQGMSGGFLVAVTLAAVFLVTTVVFAVVAVSAQSEKDDLEGERTAVAATAEQLMDALLRFDYRDPEANRDAVLALSAVQFRSQFEGSFEDTAALSEEFQMVATPTIRDVYVSDIVDDQAKAIVKYDREIETSTRTNTETGFYAEIELAKIDGEWLVTNVFNINFALGGGAGGAGANSTTTTAAPGP